MKYHVFGRHTGLRVSEIVLGTGNFGTKWGYGAQPDEAKRIFDAYAEAGGNFIDTADAYQFGESESILGDLLLKDRDAFFLASKYTFGTSPTDSILTVGNSRRAMLHSVEASLRRLKTDRLDMLWVHLPDGITPMDEIMRGLNDLVSKGKILYAGFSDFPAWRVARGSTIAELRGWTPLAGLQIEYSLVERAADRELLPMAKALGLGVAGWSPLGGGLLTGKYRRGEEGRAHSLKTIIHAEDSKQKENTVDALERLAEETGHSMGALAIAWLGTKGVLPIIGPRSHAQAVQNLAATTVSFSPDHVEMLELASRPVLGFPYDMAAASRERLGGLEKTVLPFSSHEIS